MKVHSVAREDSSSDSNFSGSLVVTRSLSSGASGPSGSLGEAPGSGQSYGPGQVLVSTGKLGTGYIRINANPNDSATPYIDIVERTGSGTFDVDLKARLGDLSGLSTERLQGTAPANAGFGLYSQNVFLEGGIIASTGSIAGVKMQNKQLFIGAGTHGNSNTAFYVSGKDDATAGDFSLGDKLVWDNSTSTLTISGQITLEAGGDTVPDTDGLISGSAQIAADISGSQTATSSSLASRQSSYETQVVLDSNGMDLRDQSSVSLANYGTTARIGRSGEGRVEISNNAIAIYDGQSTPRKRVAIDDSGKIAVGGDSGADVSVTSTDDVIRISPGSGVSIFEDSNNFSVVDSSGLTVTQGGSQVAQFAATTTIGSSTDKVTISDSGITIREDNTDVITMSGGDMTIVGGTVTIQSDAAGGGNDERVVVGSGNVAMYANDAKLVDIEDGSINIGPAADAGQAVIGNVRLGTGGAFIYGAATDDYVNVKSDGVDVVAAGTTQAAFGATTTIGDTSTEHISITSSELRLKDGSTTRILLNSSGITMGNNVSIDSSGDASFNGAITGGSLSIGSSNDILRVDTDGDLWIGNATQGSAPFQVTKAGALTASNVTITGGSLNINSVFQVASDGDITSTGGTIGGFTISSTKLANQGNSTNATSGLIKSTTADDVVLYAGADNDAASDANFSVTNAGAMNIKGTITLEKATGGSTQGLTMDGGSSGTMSTIMEGANPRVRAGATDPLGTTYINTGRGGTGNNAFFTLHTGTDGGGNYTVSGTGDNQKFSWGMVNVPSALNENILAGHRNLYNRYTVYGGTQGEYIFNIHSTNNNLEINGHTTNPAYALSVNGDIYATGNITAYSDRRRKKEITTLQNALDRVLQLRGVNYRWRRYEEVTPEDRHLLPHDEASSHGPHDQTDYENVQMGLIAQEAQDIIPEVVIENKENGCLSIDYAHMAGILVEAIKDLNKKVDEQGKLIKELQNEH